MFLKKATMWNFIQDLYLMAMKFFIKVSKTSIIIINYQFILSSKV